MRRFLRYGLVGGLLALVAMPAFGVAETGPTKVDYPSGLLAHLSSGAAVRIMLANPSSTPASMRGRLQQVSRAAAAVRDSGGGGTLGDRFNLDDVGLPQNEEAVTVCRSDPRVVVSGTNDYRGILDPEQNFSGWYFSHNGGRSVAKEGLLPSIAGLPSSGDPVVQSDAGCHIYYADLNFSVPQNGPVGAQNGVGLYRTDPHILASCPGGQDPDKLTTPACWPTRKLVASGALNTAGAGHFLDKPWMDVGQSGSAGEVVWVTYSDFTQSPAAPLGFTGAQIKAVRCTANLTQCTSPILISGADQDIQSSDVTIAKDGSTLISWVQIHGELEQTAQTFTVKVRVAPPGSTTFGPTRVVAQESNPLPYGGFLHANDFRIATYPKSIMPTVNGKPRIYVTWDRCRFRLLDTTCEEPQIVLTHSDDLGATWSTPETVSAGGDNYFPAISDEVGSKRFLIAYYTNRHDSVFHNRQDVELATIGAASGKVVRRQRVTRRSNETEADPILGGFFIGDYIDVHLLQGRAYVAYNANYRSVRVLGQGFPVPQQDNYLRLIHD